MEISEYRNIYKNERSHFFYIGNHQIIISQIKKFAYSKNRLEILDAGCGTGYFAKKLEKYGQVSAVDIHPEAIKLAKKLGIRVTKASVTKLPFTANKFDLVVSIDVLYHKLVDDNKALSEFFRVLKPGGILIIRVPAIKKLNLQHDKHVHTRERYEKTELAYKLRKAKFVLLRLSFINITLLPLALVKQLLEKYKTNNKPVSGVGSVPSVANFILKYLLLAETHLLSLTNLPIGIGLLAVCRKPKKLVNVKN